MSDSNGKKSRNNLINELPVPMSLTLILCLLPCHLHLYNLKLFIGTQIWRVNQTVGSMQMAFGVKSLTEIYFEFILNGIGNCIRQLQITSKSLFEFQIGFLFFRIQ